MGRQNRNSAVRELGFRIVGHVTHHRYCRYCTMGNAAKTRSLGLPPSDGKPDHSANANVALHDHLIGKVINGYTIIRRIGQGGMGTVFEARHNRLEKSFALKLISDSLGKNPEAIQRFRSEILALGKLDHQNIVQAVDAGQWQDRPYLVTELVKGGDLASRITERGPLGASEAAHLILQAALGLQSAHQCGLFHRDVKPSNLLVDQLGCVKLLDFGLVRSAASAQLTQAGCFMGSVDYLAPEQAANAHSADARSDLYSLGCSCIFVLSGQPPFPDSSHPSLASKLHGHLYEQPTWLQQSHPHVPDDFIALIQDLTAKCPEHRPESCQQVIDRLNRILLDSQPSLFSPEMLADHTDVPLPDSTSMIARSFMSPQGLTLAILLAGLAGWVLVRSPSQNIDGSRSVGHGQLANSDFSATSTTFEVPTGSYPTALLADEKTETLTLKSTASARGAGLPAKVGKNHSMID